MKSTMRKVRLFLALILLTACTTATTEPLPTASPPPSSATVAASGAVKPVQRASLGFTLAGRVQTVAVAVGDEVQPGEVLITLETADLEAEVAQAEAALDAAQAQLTSLQAGPRAEEIAVAEARLRAAQATVAQMIGQREQLLQAEEGSEPQIRAADAAVWAAAAQRDAAQAQLDLLLAGPAAEEIAVARAAVAQAEAVLEAARAALDQATLRAPFAGTVAALEIGPGETVLPGQTVLTLADLSRLQVETTDLSERDVGRVAVGQQATVYVEALGVEVAGRVVSVAPQATTAEDDVVYTVIIALDEQPPAIRWGMSVEVEIAASAAAIGPPPATPTVTGDEAVFAQRRERMVIETIKARGITDERVLEAMRTVPRHLFVSEQQRDHAYGDYPLPIGFGQTISQPYIVALMTELLELAPGDTVLEVGTGSGYQAAILASIPQIEVYSVEIIPELAQSAQERLQELGYQVHCKQGDGYYGWEEHAPFDAIIVTAAPNHVPPPLVDQLAEGGRMVIPVGPPGGYQTLWKFVKEPGGELKAYNMGGVAFVPLTGTGAEEHPPGGGYEWPTPW